VFAPATGIDTSTQEVFLVDGVWQVADYAAGYLHGTGVPGNGNVVMAGHQGIHGAVFASLQALKPGNDVFVDTATQRYRYRVRETGNVWPSQVSVMFPSATPTLTLMTCTNWDMQRFVVIADLVDSVALPASAS
jgi:sortase A